MSDCVERNYLWPLYLEVITRFLLVVVPTEFVYHSGFHLPIQSYHIAGHYFVMVNEKLWVEWLLDIT